MASALANIVSSLFMDTGDGASSSKTKIPDFKPGDTVRVHARIVEGNKERIQIFEGVVIRRHKRSQRSATFTVRKVSYNVGVERTFFLYSPRVEKIEVVSRGKVRRARLFYLRGMKGKSGRIKSQLVSGEEANVQDTSESGTSQPSKAKHTDADTSSSEDASETEGMESASA